MVNSSGSANIKNTPQYFVHKLESEEDVESLTSLRIALSTEPLIWVSQFREAKGTPILIKIVDKYERKTK